MKIAIDCADLDHSRIDGTRVYIKNLLNHFGKIDQASQFHLYHQKNFNSLLKPAEYPNYTDRKIPYGWWWTQTRFAYELRRDRPDACWMPIHQLPYVRPKGTRYIVTIHDLAFKIFPGHFPYSDRIKLNLFTDYAVQNADAIIAISHSTKKDILKIYPSVNENKINVIYHGFDTEEFLRRHTGEEIQTALEKYGIPVSSAGRPGAKYLLYVGAIQPRKDLPTLVSAFEQIKNGEASIGGQDFQNLKLVLVGEPAWQAEATLQRIKSSAYARDIILTGKVSFEDLTKIYQGAEAFVFPALYEGFGIPVLEAFASQIPVVVADNSSLKEIGGQVVKTFRTGSADDLVATLRNLLKDDRLKAEMTSQGRQRLEQFSWEKCAQETLDVIKNSTC